MDIMPSVEGHTLVITREAAEGILDLSPDGAAALIRTTQKVARAVKKALEAPGIMLVQLNGAAAGQSIPHIHFHVLPRSEGLDLKLHGRGMVKPEALEPVAARIRAAL
jgi:histidine triad (HIT) family protein